MPDPIGAPPPRPALVTPPWWGLHLWQIQPIRDLLVVAGALALVYLGYRLRLVTIPILLALLLAYLFEPLIRAMTHRRRFSRQGAVIAILLGAVAIIVVPAVVGISAAVVQGVHAARNVAATSGNLSTVLEYSHGVLDQDPACGRIVLNPDPADPNRIKDARFHPPEGADPAAKSAALDAEIAFGALPAFPRNVAAKVIRRHQAQAAERDAVAKHESAPVGASGARRSIDAYAFLDAAIVWIRNNAAGIAQTVGRQALGSGAGAITAVWRSINTAISLGLTIFLTAFFFYFFSTGFGSVLAFWEGLIPERKRGRVIELVVKMDQVIAGFVRGRLTICAVLIVVYILGYWMIGARAPLLLGILVGACTLVPFLPLLALPIPIILMALEPPAGPEWQQAWWWILFSPVIIYMIGQATDDYLLTPMIQGKVTQMDTPTILFASLAGGVLGGVYGLLIAIPVAACLKILLRESFWPRFKAWAQGQEADLLPISRD